LKILYIQKVKGIAGSEKYFFQMIPALISKGFTIEFLVLHFTNKESSAFVERLSQLGIKFHIYKLHPLSPIFLPFLIKKLVKKNRFVAVHTHLIHADFYAAITKAFFGLSVPVLSTKHGYDESYQARYGLHFHQNKKRGLYYLMARFSERYIKASFAVSKGLSDLFYNLQISKTPFPVILHGVEVVEYMYLPKEEPGHTLLIVGRVIKAKGHHYLLHALQKVSVPYRLIVAGDGQELAEIKEVSLKLGIAKNVDFRGYISDIDSCYREADLVIAPSIGEGFGMVVLEAFSNGKPVIAFDVPAFNEIISHGDNGFLVKPFDIDEMADVITRLLLDVSLLNKLSKNALESACNSFSLSKTIEATCAFYRQNIS
jgi:glycosyltransferase involved in cell wall biosynthesis